MTRDPVRSWWVLSCLIFLSLFNLLWPMQASQPARLAQSVSDGNTAKLLDSFVARSIGSSSMGGRISALAGVDSNPKIVYAAAASGGLWKTTDGGDNWKPIFDHQTSICIGDVAVSQSNPNIIWVGTGEANARNSVAWGDGVYKSTDGGETWQHMGLKDSHSIGRIAIHPTNPDIVYVGALGHLWGPNKERGIFKTTDGGKTWEVSKFWDENTGIIDLKMDPTDGDTLYAAAYCVRRDGFSGGNPATTFGPNAGLYKTSDGGKNWSKMTGGLPNTKFGRCGLDIYRKDTNIVFAVVQTNQTKAGESNQGGTQNGKGGPETGGIFRSDDKGNTWKHVNTLIPRPFYFGQIRVDPTTDKRVYVLGVKIFISDDAGKKFDEFFGTNLGNDNTSPHADHHAMWINPKNTSEIFEGNDGGVTRSRDKGKTFMTLRSMAIGQYYGISVDMGKPYYVYGGLQDNGGWGGPSATYFQEGIPRNLWFAISGGDGFHTQCDPTDLNTVYSESQYGTFQRVNVTNKGKGKKGKGDPGDPDDPDGGGGLHSPVAFQVGQADPKKDEQKKDEPKQADPKKDEPKKAEPQKDLQKKGGKGGGKMKQGPPGKDNRWNWSTPLVLSPHNPNAVYYGSQYLWLSTERGVNWKKISPDLTYGDGKGPNWAHTLFTIGESPKKKGVIWTGADDGRVMVTRDGGEKWTEAKMPIPKGGCVSRVEPSNFDDGTCYVSITRYRNDDRKPYIFKTTDFGESWTNVTSNLPESGSVHVVIESSRNPNLLFCGTEFGLFASLNGGQSWQQMKGGMPTVAVHDLIIHPRDRDLVIATHGRSIYIMDDISPLEQMASQTTSTNTAHLFEIRPALAYKVKPSTVAVKSNEFVGQNPPYGAIIRYQINNPTGQPVSVTIHDAAGKEVANLTGAGTAGIQQVVWNLRADGEKSGTVQAGEYMAVLWMGSFRQGTKFRVEAE